MDARQYALQALTRFAQQQAELFENPEVAVDNPLYHARPADIGRAFRQLARELAAQTERSEVGA